MKSEWGKRYAFLLFIVIISFSVSVDTFGLELLVNMPTGQTVTIQIDPDKTVGDVKEYIYDITDIHPVNQIVFKKNRELDVTQSLASYGIEDKDTLTVKYGNVSTGSVKRNGGFLKIIAILITLAVLALGIKKVFLSQ
jgi:hypothetical protein